MNKRPPYSVTASEVVNISVAASSEEDADARHSDGCVVSAGLGQTLREVENRP